MSFRNTVSAAVGYVMLIAACSGPQGSPVPVNTGDTSPPVIFTLETIGREGGELRVSQASGPVSGTLAADDSMTIFARADDPEGVKEVEIWGTDAKTCSDPQTGLSTRTGPGLVALPLAESVDTATAGGMTTNQRGVRHELDLTGFTCPQGQELSLELVFWAEAENFGGGRTRSDPLTLTFGGP